MTFWPEEVTERRVGASRTTLGSIRKGWTPRPRAAQGLGRWRPREEEEQCPRLRLFGSLVHSMWRPTAATMPGPFIQRLEGCRTPDGEYCRPVWEEV